MGPQDLLQAQHSSDRGGMVVHSALLESFGGFRCTYMTDEANAKLYVA